MIVPLPLGHAMAERFDDCDCDCDFGNYHTAHAFPAVRRYVAGVKREISKDFFPGLHKPQEAAATAHVSGDSVSPFVLRQDGCVCC